MFNMTLTFSRLNIINHRTASNAMQKICLERLGKPQKKLSTISVVTAQTLDAHQPVPQIRLMSLIQPRLSFLNPNTNPSLLAPTLLPILSFLMSIPSHSITLLPILSFLNARSIIFPCPQNTCTTLSLF